MEIYLDANATTPVLPQARAAAVAVMEETFGNPSSLHSSGLRARALLDQARASARRVLGVANGQLLFTSGATEGIQTAVLSALSELQRRRDAGERSPSQVLYGATEHKAVPEAIKHWNEVLGLRLAVKAIPVGRDGRHDLTWLREHAASAGLVCTMAANNETGVISDLDGIADALGSSEALWLVDSVQGLGKLPLKLLERGIDYAPFSGHKLYAPKGIGMLYVRDGAPFTALMTGGGQESARRSGTENMAGIAALGAVLMALEDGKTFQDTTTLSVHRLRLEKALQDAFPGLVLNAPADICLPTTLNFAVPGLSSKVLLDLFDAAGLRVSGGSACSAAKAEPSFVLEAMGLPDWQASSAVRMSFGAADRSETIELACARIRACGSSLRASCLTPVPQDEQTPAQLLTRFAVNGSCCYVVADVSSRRCVIIDPLPEVTDRLAQWVRCRGYALAAILDTHSHGDHASSAGELRNAVPSELLECGAVDGLGWPEQVQCIPLGDFSISRLPIPGHTEDSTAYLLHQGSALRFALVGDAVLPGALGRSDFPQSAPLLYAGSLKTLEQVIGQHTMLLPGHDYEDRFATTLNVEAVVQPLLARALGEAVDAAAFAAAKADIERDIAQTAHQTMACGARVDTCAKVTHVELPARAVNAMLRDNPHSVLVDVREPYEQMLGGRLRSASEANHVAVPITGLINALPGWLALQPDTPVIFYCRSGNRSAQAARALRRLGHPQAWSLEGGLALWPHEEPAAGADLPVTVQ